MLRKLYDWVFSLARSRHATPALAVVSFTESSFFPIPPDVMLGPMILARPERAYFYAMVCTVASVLGGMLGYAIGYFLTDVGMMILSWLGKADTFEAAKALFAITRGGRFFAEAWVLKRWGPAVLAMVEKRLALWTFVGLAVLVGAIVAVKLL